MRILMIAALSLILPGCATVSFTRGDYKLQVGDKLKVIIFGEMEEQALIRLDHKISLPFVGELSTRGKTADLLSQELTAKYKMTTVVMVQEYRTWQQTLKEALGLARDLFIVFFALQRLADD